MKNKTTTLPPSIGVPKKIQNLAKLIQFFSTKLAVKFAYKLFVTPVKFKVPEREKIMYKSAQKKRIYIDNLDKEIDVIEYGYSPKRVLLVHGWSGRATQFFMLADKLLENGYMIISFDAPAHLNSEGKTTSLIEFIEVVKQLNNEFDGFTSAVGHSLGGVTLYNTAKELNLKSMVSIGAADKITEIIDRFVESIGMKPKVAKKLKKFIDKDIKDDTEKYSSSIHAKDVYTPTLVVHDKQDKDVAINCADTIQKSLPIGKTLITDGLGHTRILRDIDTVNKIVSFIKKH